ncbi:hypothetical protein RJT34_19203 [Clitoria ternatea]|uniref:X8 domain-containing protein n=1 Tax=Clitoria ternatea TaxID=43366 RepID=A0AAN9IQL3_CLITE
MHVSNRFIPHCIMTKETSLYPLFLSFLIIFCSGSLMDFSYGERGDISGIAFLLRNKIYQSQIRVSVTGYKILSTLTNTDMPLDFLLNESLVVENFTPSKPSQVSWLKPHLVDILSQVDVRSIIVSCGSECLGHNEIPLLASTLKSIHSFLSELQLSREVKVSVAFPLSLLENLDASYEIDLLRIVRFLKKINSFLIIEDNIGGNLSMEDYFVQSFIKGATLNASILACKDVPLVLKIKSQVVPSSIELAQFGEVASKYLEARSHVTKRIVAFYAEIHNTKDSGQKEMELEEEEDMFRLSFGEKMSKSKVHVRRILQATNNSPTPIFPTNPTPPTPVITPSDTPTIITVPSSNPVTVSPTSPGTTPVTVPSTTPVPLAPTNPGAAPVTNPVASYPPPPGSVLLPPPPSTTAQATPGQSWCVAKTGVPETSLQSALDYACGMPSVDCSQIQQGGSCYNPNSIQNHASFAFNSYYQKNPSPTSCDFGGTATLVSTNPSTGSCIYPSSSGASSATSPSVLGSQSPPVSSTSNPAGLRPFLSCMILLTSLITGVLTV